MNPFSHRIEMTIVRAIREKKRKGLLFVLFLISQCFKFIVFIRNRLYEWKIFSSHRARAPVISIGNIVAGGTGKTPMTMMLIEALKNEYPLAVISSGYRRALQRDARIELNDPNAPLMGDEPYLIAKKYPDVHVYSTRDYLRTALSIEEKLILLDDGFQKRKLERDCDMICMRADDLLGEGYFLPRGFLRDDPKRLKECDLICIMGIKNEEQYQEICGQLRSFSKAAVIGVNWRAEAILPLDPRDKVLAPGALVAAFCAIANPSSFLETLHQTGFQCIASKAFADHSFFDQKELELFAKEAALKGASALICSEKDVVKMDPTLSLNLPIYHLSGKLMIEYGIKHFNDLISQVVKWKEAQHWNTYEVKAMD
ncbi:MAG: tetraacyldisaccharide 4'-kinase [Simkaniaceae bacterium]|nr:tetraacyldisaccharide 4'-kinase [Simkaniaceae bacterium]